MEAETKLTSHSLPFHHLIGRLGGDHPSSRTILFDREKALGHPHPLPPRLLQKGMRLNHRPSEYPTRDRQGLHLPGSHHPRLRQPSIRNETTIQPSSSRHRPSTS